MMDIEVLKKLVEQLISYCSLQEVKVNGKPVFILKIRTHEDGLPGGLWQYVDPQEPESFQWALAALQSYMNAPDKKKATAQLKEHHVQRFGRS